MEIPYEKQFHFRDGTSVGSLNALKDKLEIISYAEFYHHVNSDKNDFASWVKHILKDENLADDLQRVNSIVETVEILEDYLHPRAVIAPRTDIQSKIENAVLKQQLPSNTDESVNVETMPHYTVPSLASNPEPIDMRLIEEKLGLRSSTPETFSASAESSATPEFVAEEKKVREELFGQHDSAQSILDAKENPASENPASSSNDSRRMWQKSESDSDMTRLIVKDFIYGLIFGLILGMILGRIISM